METKNKPLTVNDGGAAFLMMMTVYVFLSFFGQTILFGITDGKIEAWTIAVSACFSALSIAAVLLYFKYGKKHGFISITSVKKCGANYYLLALILSAGMFLGLGFINTAFSSLLEDWGLSINAISFPLENAGHLVLFNIVFALIPAVAEELFFRGLTLNAVKGGKTVWAVTCVAVSFALYHCSAAQFLYQLVYGVALCVLAIYSGSVLPCVLAHFVNNAAVIFLTYFKVNVNLFSPYFIACGLILLGLFFFITVRGIIKKQGEKAEKNNKNNVKTEKISSYYLPFGLFGSAICILLLIGNLFAV